MEEPQPHDSQNRINKPSDYQTLGLPTYNFLSYIAVIQTVLGGLTIQPPVANFLIAYLYKIMKGGWQQIKLLQQ